MRTLSSIIVPNEPTPSTAQLMFVDDTSTVHCKFDNGRQLGIIPGEDSFRKLTDEELAEEQADSEDMDEGNGPVMGM